MKKITKEGRGTNTENRNKRSMINFHIKNHNSVDNHGKKKESVEH